MFPWFHHLILFLEYSFYHGQTICNKGELFTVLHNYQHLRENPILLLLFYTYMNSVYCKIITFRGTLIFTEFVCQLKHKFECQHIYLLNTIYYN